MKRNAVRRGHLAAVFDLDGVLVDTAVHHTAAWQRISAEYGFELSSETAEATKGVGRFEALDLVMRSAGIELSESERRAAAARKNEYYLGRIADISPAELLPGAVSTLSSLNSLGVRIALASGSKNAGHILDRTGIRHFFDAVVDGTVVAAPKPDPTVFLEASRLVGVSPAESVVVEDAAAGVEGANRAGCTTIGIGLPSVLCAAHLVAPGLLEVDWAAFFGPVGL
ncbi:beta-phosphoglucomutase family hydrolase [Streptomyces shenzhenensis]|uniref:beta-phosphoglucomutase family hydrolase n=1 Tax=Streptomyces shenzhenensis TaxID=943815 RepID=UPI0033C5245C